MHTLLFFTAVTVVTVSLTFLQISCINITDIIQITNITYIKQDNPDPNKVGYFALRPRHYK